MKIRTRISLQFTLVVASLLAIFSFSIYWFALDHREEEFNKRLYYKGHNSARTLLEHNVIDSYLLQNLQQQALTPYRREEILIYDPSNKLVYSKDNFENPEYRKWILEIRKHRNLNFSVLDKECVGLLYYTPKGYYVVIVAAFDEYGFHRMQQLRYLLISGVLIGSIVIFVTGWFFAKKSLKPISRIIREAQEISGKNAHERLTVGNSTDELSSMAQTFNQMLDRVHQTMQIQKSFLSNASHELRTPLAIIRARLELTLTNKNADYLETLETLYHEIKDLIDLSNGLLEMTHLDSGVRREMMQAVRLDELLFSAVAECKRKYPAQKIDLVISDQEDDAKLLIEGFDQLLTRCFINLIDNACKYSSGKPVVIEVSSSGHRLLVAVRDNGIGIAENELDNVQKPFYRASNTKDFPGHGIGLSLVNKILDVHNAQMKIDSTLHKGTTIKVEFELPEEV